jgi:hypothetical protein
LLGGYVTLNANGTLSAAANPAIEDDYYELPVAVGFLAPLPSLTATSVTGSAATTTGTIIAATPPAAALGLGLATAYLANNPQPGSVMNPLPRPRPGQSVSTVGGPRYVPQDLINTFPKIEPPFTRRECLDELDRCFDWANGFYPNQPWISPHTVQERTEQCQASFKQCTAGEIPDWPHLPNTVH